MLEWLQDINWPVAGPVADHLITIADQITPQIIDVLRGDDVIWKYWCLVVFGRMKSINPLLLREIGLLAQRVTQGEIREGVLKDAQSILKEHSG